MIVRIEYDQSSQLSGPISDFIVPVGTLVMHLGTEITHGRSAI